MKGNVKAVHVGFATPATVTPDEKLLFGHVLVVSVKELMRPFESHDIAVVGYLAYADEPVPQFVGITQPLPVAESCISMGAALENTDDDTDEEVS